MSEAETIRFVRERTTIPIPQVHDAYVDDESGMVRIVMEFIEGENLDSAWNKYTDAEKESVISQLRGYMEELRQIKGSFIGSVDNSWCNDHYFDDKRGAYGPFASEAEFNRGISKALKEAKPEDWVEFTCDIFQEVMNGHEIVMTHNDLDPRNILVQGSQVVALLDWELSGFYPEYWEYCKAMRRPDWETRWVRDRALDKILKPYRKELSVIWNTMESIW
jgi:aminoglycoside phosphotransferase (APT) family kinase protein